MKISVLFLSCAFTGACSSPHVPVPTPVTMEYNVSVEILEDTCADSAIPTDLQLTLKVVLQTDDTMVVTYPAGFVPGYGDYKGMIITDGYTEGMLLTKDGNPDLSVTGDLTMDSADLVFEGQRVLVQDDGTQVPCAGNTKVRLSGPARPLWVNLALDGKYEADYDFYSLVCPPSDPEVNDPISWVVPLDIQDRQGSALFSFNSHNETVWFEMPTSTLASGSINWDGTLHITEQESVDGVTFVAVDYPYEANVTGTFVDGSYYLRMKINNPEYGVCRFVLDATGFKHPPDTVSINNVYRLAFLESNSCIPDANGNPKITNFVMEGDVALRVDGSYLSVMHGFQRFDLRPDPNTTGFFSGKWGNSNLTLDYTAFVAPPEVNLFYTWGRQPQGGGTCNEEYTANGVVGFYPELKLEFPKTRNAKRQLNNATERLPLNTFGPLGTALIKSNKRSLPLSEAPQFVREAIMARRANPIP